MRNVSGMPEDYWAWDGDKLTPLGICDGFEEASDKGDDVTPSPVWLFSRTWLTALRDDINKELK